MENIKGTKTEANLQTAFAGESQARNKYTYFASVAKKEGCIKESEGWTDIFIYPGYQFKVIDGLITNFHLPESTLIMLVSALAGREHVLAAYEEAIRERYRFFSFGDAMLIL